MHKIPGGIQISTGRTRKHRLLTQTCIGQWRATIALICCTLISPAYATEWCVDTAAELNDALNAAHINFQDDTIMVVQGTYHTQGSEFYHYTSQNYALKLQGGYTSNCSDRVLDPRNTVLDGNSSNRVLHISSTAAAGSPDILLQGFTIQNGKVACTSCTVNGAGALIG